MHLWLYWNGSSTLEHSNCGEVNIPLQRIQAYRSKNWRSHSHSSVYCVVYVCVFVCAYVSVARSVCLSLSAKQLTLNALAARVLYTLLCFYFFISISVCVCVLLPVCFVCTLFTHCLWFSVYSSFAIGSLARAYTLAHEDYGIYRKYNFYNLPFFSFFLHTKPLLKSVVFWPR